MSFSDLVSHVHNQLTKYTVRYHDPITNQGSCDFFDTKEDAEGFVKEHENIPLTITEPYDFKFDCRDIKDD